MEQAYPHILCLTGLHDQKTPYWEALKWIAKIREANQSNNHVILHINKDTGHGTTGRYTTMNEFIKILDFIFRICALAKLEGC
ncbi:MAG: prolyl oligopeptidase family serine peptidase [Flammeovirgaceae bacterium]